MSVKLEVGKKYFYSGQVVEVTGIGRYWFLGKETHRVNKESEGMYSLKLDWIPYEEPPKPLLPSERIYRMAEDMRQGGPLGYTIPDRAILKFLDDNAHIFQEKK